MTKNLRNFGITLLLFTFSLSYAGEKTIVIDVSHGGKDDGIAIDGFKEKDLAFEIALKIAALNTADDVKIVLTREGDYFVPLKDRVEQINTLNPDYVISLHINSSEDTSLNGFDFFVSADAALNKESKDFAQKVETSIAREFRSNGVKNANFYILKNVAAPVTLIEMGFLSNPDDHKILTSVAGQNKIAEAIYNIIK
ncbi:N-acetylmuramoyl-L-alanine amidase family protein [Aequorivita marina]|uniref:N-acetylmuramoyl-L-alanine amidase family protein n=1 Tax=Aequorivita marina TaxID=3073654 RepID=UPI0028751742|nr:N-acetylmuramoyl-L-alanine amidase [Aequorivita sp. S2608]MDS1298854.1 N-acetylmuramoyl-L-alanine amidase [Aequorivita sp. S2608]